MSDVTENERLPSLGGRRLYAGGARFAEGDVLFARITPSLENGKTAFVKTLPAPHVGHGSTEFITISGKPGVSDSLFAYYLMRLPSLREYAASQMSGSSGRQRVSWEALATYRRPIPDLPEQERISAVLGSIDDKIESNRRCADLYERVAEGVFEYVFLAFRGEECSDESTFGLIPPNYVVRPLGEVVDVNPIIELSRGADSPFIEMADVRPWTTRPFRLGRRVAGSGCRFEARDSLFARIAGCVEHGKGAFLDFIDEPGTGSTEFIVLRARSELTPEAVFLLSRNDRIRQHVMAQMSGSSGRQRIPPDAFRTVPVCLPRDQSIWEKEAAAISACFARSRVLWQECFDLARLRDGLMLELLEGRLRIDELGGKLDASVSAREAEEVA